MASSGHFDPTQIYDCYKEIFKNATTVSLGRSHADELGNKLQTSGGTCGVGRMGPLEKSSHSLRLLLLMVLQGILLRDVARWTNVGELIPVGGRPIYSSSEVPISRINTEGIVKRIRQIYDSPPYPDAEGSYELDGEEVEVIPHYAGHPSNSSPSQPPAKRFQSQVIPSTPRNFQPTLATIPPASPHSSHTRHALNSEVRPSPVQQSRNSPIVNSQQLQPVASTSRRREEIPPFPFPDSQGFQHRDQWPMHVTREDQNMASDKQDAVARLLRSVDRNSREVIMYANDRAILGTASEEMAATFSWYEDEFCKVWI
ncbi:hypothetical protein O181_117965 [Austropuccinia psidii MF-1]|uniref:Uncharacterized protein n=1 Tax=Austropuccinia psidii MF-1 TaxID=1389203 RepID=A0A9Q3KBD5_9BASI|nr:hypothetical protein [Austropuccinia psidii MF-1]